MPSIVMFRFLSSVAIGYQDINPVFHCLRARREDAMPPGLVRRRPMDLGLAVRAVGSHSDAGISFVVGANDFAEPIEGALGG